MSQRIALTVAERETIYREKLDGHSLKELAQKQHCAESCARTWWRIGRDHGLDGLHRMRSPRSAPAVLSSFDPRVTEHALSLKRQHPKRGATRIVQDLVEDPSVIGHPLPKRSSLTEFFHRVCPELLRS